MLRLSALILSFSFGLAIDAAADVTRACEGDLLVSVGPPASGLGSAVSETIARLRGVGACANSAWANRCRERARDFIDECRQDLWGNRFTHPLPASCRSLVGGRTGARLTYNRAFAYANPDAVFFRVVHTACCRLRPNDSSVTAKVHGAIWGGKKCGAKQQGFPYEYRTNYTMAPAVGIDCNHWRQQGICG
jgi:hypothetical protein